MFRISYIDIHGNVAHKGGFKSDKDAYTWIDSNPGIIPLKLLVWSEEIQCFDTFKVL